MVCCQQTVQSSCYLKFDSLVINVIGTIICKNLFYCWDDSNPWKCQVLLAIHYNFKEHRIIPLPIIFLKIIGLYVEIDVVENSALLLIACWICWNMYTKSEQMLELDKKISVIDEKFRCFGIIWVNDSIYYRRESV